MTVLSGHGPRHHVGVLTVSVSEAMIGPGTLTGLVLERVVALDRPKKHIGGLSGLALLDGTLHMIADAGWLFSMPYSEAPLPPEAAIRVAALHDGSSAPFEGSEGDAEALTVVGGKMIAAFERHHRIAGVDEDGALAAPMGMAAFGDLGFNRGLEALATLPDGRLLGLAEDADRDGTSLFLIGGDGTVTAHRIALTGPHAVTGADIGPDGLLYIVQRNFSVFTGFSVRVRRMAVGANGLPDVESLETLAAYESADRIDNMEGIVVWRGADGRLRLTLVSDDNFNPLQRMLLVDFLIDD